jgi:hypothetical protein
MATRVQTQVGRFVWHGLNTTDVEKAKAFYTQLLGWEIEVWKPGEMDYPMISVGGQQHGGFSALQPGQEAPPHWLGHICVENVDATVAKAKSNGGSVLFEMDMPEVGRFAVIADPAGAAFSAYQPEGDPPASEGVFVWDELIASDVEAAKAFYTKVIGWTTADMDMGEAGVYTLLNRAGDVNAAGILKKPAEMGSAPDSWLTYLATDDVDATAQRAVELGGQLWKEPFDVGVGRLAVLADSTGAAFGIFKPAPTA